MRNPSSSFSLDIDSTSYPSPIDDYLHEVTSKKNICLHATAGGSLVGAVETLAKQDHIAVHFIVDKNGKIYQFFPLRYWAFHLGIKNTGGRYDRSTIGIEIVNVGPLVRRGDNLCYWPNNFTAKYCSVNDTQSYTKVEGGWRGYEYYANFTKSQCDNVAALCAYLCHLENITAQILPDIDEYHLDQINNFSGIYTHTSVRKDKYDVGKGWPWPYFSKQLAFYAAQIEESGTLPALIVE